MARIDDYQQALALVREELSGKDPDQVSGFSGAKLLRDSQGERSFSLTFLKKEITVSWPDLVVSTKQPEGDLSIQQQVLLLHYMLGAGSTSGSRITGEWIAFQDIPDGRFYLDASPIAGTGAPHSPLSLPPSASNAWEPEAKGHP